jgi:hypothetical protein
LNVFRAHQDHPCLARVSRVTLAHE